MSPIAENYVTLRIRALDDAKPDLTELKADLDELGHKIETAKVDVDDDDASVKLLRMNARLAELNHKLANPKIRIDGAARAEAELAALDLELDRLKDKGDTSGPSGLLGRILNGAGDQFFANGPPSGGILGSLFGPQGLVIVPAIGAALVEITGLISGIAAAGAGAASFGLLAYPAVKKVETAYTDLNTAQQAYQTAQAKYAADPTKTNATAMASALDNLKAQQKLLSEMSPQEQGAITGVRMLAAEFGKLSRAFEPEAFKVFSSGLQLIDKLLPDIVPFAKTFADVMSQLLGQAGKFSSSKGFTDFLKQFHGIEGPALTAIGDGIGKVTIAFGKLITTMSGKDVAQTIGIAFNTVAGILDGVAGVVKKLMQNWDSMSSAARRDTHEVAVAFDALRTDIANWAQDVQRSADGVVRWFQALPGKILGALEALPGMLFRAGQNAVKSLISGLGSMLGSLGSMAGDLASKVAGFFGLSPAKEGPLSGGGAPWIRGQHFVQDFAGGMLGERGRLAQAAGQIASAAGGVPGGYGTAAAAGDGTITFKLGSGGSGIDQLFMTWLKNAVRAGGGDPAIFNKKVRFL